jgi:hypothetical protein
MRHHGTGSLLGFFGMVAVLLLSGCGADLADASVEGVNASTNNDEVVAGDDISLYDSDLQTARSQYAEVLAQNPADGVAAAGHAVTDVLLLPYAPETTAVLKHFGASDSLDAQGDIIFGESGFLYFVSRGVPWEDSGPDTVGIKSLLVDKLPWTRRQLDSVDGFVDGLDKPVDFMVEDLVLFADRLDDVQADIDTAIDDPNFISYFVPGDVVHDDSLDITLGRGELSLLKASISGMQTAIYFMAAYDHGWSLERAFGTSVWEEVVIDLTHPDHIDGWTAEDYQVAHLNESFMHRIGRPMMLLRAQQSFADTFGNLRRAIEFGLEQTVETSLAWQEIDEQTAHDLIDFLAAWEQSATGAAEIPFTQPTMTVDFSPLFAEGRTIPMETDAFLLQRYENEFGATETSIEVNESAIEGLADGLFDPAYGSDTAIELSRADQFEALVDRLSGEFTTDVERTYSGSF